MTETVDLHWLEQPLDEDDPAIVAIRDDVLARIAADAPTREVLTAICRGIESQEDGVIASVLLVSEDGRHLVHGAAPSLPEAYCLAIDGVEVADGVGACGTAAATGRTVITDDVLSDPRWADFRDLATSHGLRSCHSTPVKDDRDRVIATFALYRRRPSTPTLHERQLAAYFSHLVDVALRVVIV